MLYERSDAFGGNAEMRASRRVRATPARARRAARLAVSVVCLCLARSAAPADVPLPPEKVRAIESLISIEMSRRHIPGLGLAVVTGSQLRLVNAYGLADLENFVPVRIDTVFRLASLSKSVTAVAVMQLVERGEVDLDAPIQKYVPTYPQKPWPITVRQLLCHQSGIRHHTDAEWTNNRHYATLTDSLQVFAESPLAFEPGTKTLYSSYGYTLLGSVVESVSGMSYAEYLRQNVFRPATMERTQVDDHFELIPGRASGYFEDGTGRIRNSPLADTSNRIPGGGLCGTAADIGRFAAAFQSGALVKSETAREMLAKQRTRDGKRTGYGLGWIVSEKHVRLEAWCTGAQPQVSACLFLRPDGQIAVAILTNLEGVSDALTDLARRIADTVLR
jgi:serine beta-lactamase-like protein LACTB, mitochondrial